MLFNSVYALPPEILKKIPSKAGRKIFLESLNHYQHHNETLMYAKAWAELDSEGYTENSQGQFTKSKKEELVKTVNGFWSFVRPDEFTKKQLVEWMEKNGIPDPIDADDLHVTIHSSRVPVSGYEPLIENLIVKPTIPTISSEFDENYGLMLLGENKESLVLKFSSWELDDQFWKGLSLGATWDFDEKIHHITLTNNVGDFDFREIPLPDFMMRFEPEQVRDFETNEPLDLNKFDIHAEIINKNDEQQMLFAWASVIEKDGVAIVDRQGDVIEESDLIQAAHDFISNSRESKEMHDGGKIGEVVESVVFTKDLQNALGINLNKIGWFVGIHVTNKKVWDKIKSRELTMLSIGGTGVREAILDEQEKE